MAVTIAWAVSMTVLATRRASGAADGTLTPEEGLARELAKPNNDNALAEFWEEINGKMPLVEPAANDPTRSWVTFIWRGDASARTVSMQGGPATGDFAAKLSRLGKTDLWYRTDLVPNDARFTYFFQVNRPLRFPSHSEKLPPIAPPRADPLNPRKLPGDRSLAELPKAPPEPWLTRVAGAPRGKLSEHTIRSKCLKGAWPDVELQRRFAVYTPPNYDPKGPSQRLLLMFDGNGYAGSDLPVPLILDRLIGEKKIPATVAVFIFQSVERSREVGCSEPFADFVATELVPWVWKNYTISQDPAQVIAGGMSGGGLQAAFCAYRHSKVIGNVLSLSGGFGFWPSSLEERMDEEPGWLTREFVKAPKLPLRFYLAAGSFENWFFPYSMLTENRRIRDVLQAKGYPVAYREFSGGHDPIGWRGPFVEGLIAFSSPATTP
jgi:enterochelin esterase-like enzyme